MSHTPYYVNVKDTYTSDPVVLNDSSAGMWYWLDVAWNVYVGVKTKYAWIAATVLGIEPSAFSSTYRSGDTLTNTTTKVYNRKCYYMYNNHSEHDVLYYETYKLVITEYVDLYTSTGDGNPYRESGEETFTFYTEHYDDTAWIKEYVTNACNNGLLFQRDEIP